MKENTQQAEKPVQQGRPIPLDKLLARLGEKDLEIVLMQEKFENDLKSVVARIEALQKENSVLTEKNLSLERELNKPKEN